MMADSPLPPVLYKYVSSLDAVKNILAGQIKFASFYELNDGTEGTTVVDLQAIEQSLWHLKHSGITEGQFEKYKKMYNLLAKSGIPAKLNFEDIAEANSMFRSSKNDKVAQVLKLLSKSLTGNSVRMKTHSLHFLCLTKRFDSLPMWVHYANRGLGYLIVFRSLNQVFPAVDPWDFNGLHPVRYHRLRPSVTYDPISLENMFLSKTLDWQYEEEIRVIKLAQDLINFENPQLELSMKIFELDPKHIAGVVLGYKIASEDREEIFAELRDCSKTAILSHAELNPDGRIDIKEFKP